LAKKKKQCQNVKQLISNSVSVANKLWLWVIFCFCPTKFELPSSHCLKC